MAVPPQPDVAGVPARVRRSAPHRFHLSRCGPHPRAKAVSGRVLPRAYVRHTPVSTRAIEREPLAPLGDEERPLDVVIELAPAPSTTAVDGSAAVERATPKAVSLVAAPASVAPERLAHEASVPNAAAADAVTPEASAPEASASASLTSEALSGSAPAVESLRDRTISAEDAARNEVLARVRRQAQRPNRVLVHDAAPQHGRRFIGSLTFFVATAVVVVGVLVALAILARRSPGFPF